MSSLGVPLARWHVEYAVVYEVNDECQVEVMRMEDEGLIGCIIHGCARLDGVWCTRK